MLTTDRLSLKIANLTDAADLFDLNSDPEVVRYTGDKQMLTIMDAEQVIKERLLPDFSKYKMGRFFVYKKDGTFIGWCGLKFYPETNDVDLGYRFKKNYWGQGFATEAAMACLEFGFEQRNLVMIMAKAMPDNIGSIKVMQKLGMSFKGYHHDPTDPHPFVRYELTKEQYRACKE